VLVLVLVLVPVPVPVLVLVRAQGPVQGLVQASPRTRRPRRRMLQEPLWLRTTKRASPGIVACPT
jgi:hypothetical protein